MQEIFEYFTLLFLTNPLKSLSSFLGFSKLQIMHSFKESALHLKRVLFFAFRVLYRIHSQLSQREVRRIDAPPFLMPFMRGRG